MGWVHRSLFWQLSTDGRGVLHHGVGPQEPLLATIPRWKLAWFGHFMCHDSLSKTILLGMLEGGWHHGWQRKCWMDIIIEWTSLPMPELLTRASYRKDWKRISAGLSLMSPWWPNQSRDWTELLNEVFTYMEIRISASVEEELPKLCYSFSTWCLLTTDLKQTVQNGYCMLHVKSMLNLMCARQHAPLAWTLLAPPKVFCQS